MSCLPYDCATCIDVFVFARSNDDLHVVESLGVDSMDYTTE